MFEKMAAQNLWYYRDQIFRIVEESLEVAMVICNSELSEFTLGKIFDIFNQILPTGFVLNTGYWPFYNTLKRQSICVCARYGIDCRHYKHDHHWLDLECICEDDSIIFSTKLGQLCILNSETDVTPITGGTAGYTFNMNLTFQYKKVERGRPRRKKDENLNINQNQIIHFDIYSRFGIQREYYPAFHTVMFQPSPFFYETYGSYFPRLLQARPSVLLNHLSLEMNQKYYTASVESMPHFSLILQHVNLPSFLYSRNIHAVYTYLDPPRLKKMTHNKSCQTEEEENMTEVWRYKELIGNLKPIWSDAKAPSSDSLLNNAQTINVDYVFETYVMDDKQMPGQCTITEIKNEVESNEITESILSTADSFNASIDELDAKNAPQDLPISTSTGEDHDVQWPKWGYQKAVTRRRGRKKNQNGYLYRDVLVGSHKKHITAELDFPQIKSKSEAKRIKTQNDDNNNQNGVNGNISAIASIPTYAAVLKGTESDKGYFEYTDEARATVYETHKNDPDFQWFESQLPYIQPSAVLTKEEIHDKFEIAKEFIREEMERENTKKVIIRS